MLKLIVDSNMATSVPEVTAACALFLTLPVTVASAERSFSKLKLIVTFVYEISQFDWTVSPSCEGVKVL